jgi:lipopolysaccharide cholinephosphotransferase
LTDSKVDIKNLQKALMAVFAELVSYMESNNISYYLAYGTLLGSVRDSQVIPWDDDIDIFVQAKDLERLLFLIEENLGDLVRITRSDDRSKPIIVPIKLELLRVSGVEKKLQDMGVPIDKHLNPSIDIFPLAGIKKVTSPLKLFSLHIVTKIWVNAKIMKHSRYALSNRNFFIYSLRKCLSLIPLRMCESIYQFLHKFKSVENPECVTVSILSLTSRTIFPIAYFDSYSYGMLNGIRVRIPVDSPGILTMVYSKEYNVIPIESEQVGHFSKIIFV